MCMFGLDGLRQDLDQPRVLGECNLSKYFKTSHNPLAFSAHGTYTPIHKYTYTEKTENSLSCICKIVLGVCFDFSHSTYDCLLGYKISNRKSLKT